jgi:serine phosphatase RsbU (regulator of sigma subunit)
MSAMVFPASQPGKSQPRTPITERTMALLQAQRAADIQRALMPPPLHVGAFVDVAATTHPCWTVGGDFYDYLERDREFRVMLGDACGNGTAAALQAALVQGILALEAEDACGPARVMTQLNRALCRRLIPARFVTMFYGILTPAHRLVYCNAGQCLPLLVSRDRVAELSVGGPPLGVMPEASFEETALTVEAGDVLVVYTDGIIEAAGGTADAPEDFGDARVLDLVRAHRDEDPADIAARLVAAVTRFTGGARACDDRTAIVVRYLG